MRVSVLVLCALICLFVVLAEARQRRENQTGARSLERRHGNRIRENVGHQENVARRGNVGRRGNRLAARGKNSRRRRQNAARKNRKRRNLAKKKNHRTKAKSRREGTSTASSGSSYAVLPLDFDQNYMRTTDSIQFERVFLAHRYGLSFAATTGRTALANTGNMQYTCKGFIGGQKFIFLPDTGSSNIWVPGPHCESKACKVHNRYHPGKSSTYVKNGTAFAIDYESGSVEGVLAMDNMKVAGLTVTNQTFAMTTKEPGSVFVKSKFDGILGLGYQSISVDNVKTLVQNMCSEDVITTCVFAICMRGGGSSSRGGALIFGSTDTSAYTGSHSYTYTPVTKQGYWQFKLQGIYVGGTKVGGPIQAIVDSGTSLITAPPRIYKKINQILGCTETSSGECWMECSKAVPYYEFEVAGVKLRLPGHKMMMRVKTKKGRTICLSAVTLLDGPVILGDSLIRHYCVIFDLAKNRIGFAATTYSN
ncbi:lysosomal aspartic protease [Drosophila ficusphila]|uniref:lysosomal aspartic protease n=1 Tax=Drosophila ficusphila TaxID=30025 RepID=UPI0007E830B7|nr:lysosomal aspartic protease [Drosophila ficusphila]